ncbi:MAG: hypothetical protein WD696_21720 [Bryobacteraceae bacterium]
MIRKLFFFLITIIALAVVRYAVVMIMKAIGSLSGPGAAGTSETPTATATPRSGGELRKDPVCGTFVSVSASVQKTVDGEVMHFCSAACRDKYKLA